MANPIQTITGSVVGANLVLAFTTRPSVNNWIILPVIAYFPYPLPAVLSLRDSAGRGFASLFSQSMLDAHGGTIVQAVYASQIPSNAGTPNYFVQIQTALVPSGLQPFLQACAFECSQLASAQPDLAASSLQQPGGGPALTLTPQLPTQNNDFAVAVMTVNGQSTWNTQSGWTSAQANKNDSAHLVNGEIDWQQAPGGLITSFSINWNTISNSTVGNQGFMVLFQGAPSGVSFSHLPGLAAPLGIPVKQTSDNNLTLKAGLAKPLGLPAQLTGRSYWAVPGLARPIGLPVQCKSSGNLTLAALPGRAGPIGLPAELVFSSPTLQIRRGPLSALANISLKEGEPFEAEILNAGVATTLLFVGSHDGTKKLIGGGVQVVTAAPGWTTTQNGVVLWDTTNHVFYVSSGGAWITH